MTMSQWSADAATPPAAGLVAVPEKVIMSSTSHVVPAAGAVIVAVGGVLLAVIVIGELIVDAPCGSVTRSLAVYVPGCVYVKLGWEAVESSKPRRRRGSRHADRLPLGVARCGAVERHLKRAAHGCVGCGRPPVAGSVKYADAGSCLRRSRRSRARPGRPGRRPGWPPARKDALVLGSGSPPAPANMTQMQSRE